MKEPGRHPFFPLYMYPAFECPTGNHYHWGGLGIRGTQVKSSIQYIVNEVAPIKKATLWG
jgi:hypothetical protein